MRTSPRNLFLIAIFFVLLATIYWFNPISSSNRSQMEQSSQSKSALTKQNNPVKSPSDAAKALSPTITVAQTSMDSRTETIRRFPRGRSPSPGAPSELLLERIPRGSAQSINNKALQVLGARAVLDSDYTPSMGDILTSKNGYKVVPLDPSVSEEIWQDLTLKSGERPVVFNPASGQLAIVTGTIIVALKNPSQAQALAAREHLQIIGVDEAISTVFLKAPEGYGLISGLRRIEANSDLVSNVSLELFLNKKVPR